MVRAGVRPWHSKPARKNRPKCCWQCAGPPTWKGRLPQPKGGVLLGMQLREVNAAGSQLLACTAYYWVYDWSDKGPSQNAVRPVVIHMHKRTIVHLSMHRCRAKPGTESQKRVASKLYKNSKLPGVYCVGSPRQRAAANDGRPAGVRSTLSTPCCGRSCPLPHMAPSIARQLPNSMVREISAA